MLFALYEEDRQKIAMLYQKYYHLMFGAAYDILHDRQLSEDMVHTAFEKIIKQYDYLDLSNEGKTKSLIVIITRNCALNVYNKRKKHCSVSIDEPSTPEIAVCDKSFLEVEQLLSFQAHLEKMEHIYADILTLRYVHDLQIKDIAKILGISKSNAKVRLHRAREFLLTSIREERRNERK